MGVLESRNAFEKKPEKMDVDSIRIQLYRLMMGNWNSTILDLGDIEEGEYIIDLPQTAFRSYLKPEFLSLFQGIPPRLRQE